MVLLQDYRDGKLGRISLETPETRREMLSAKPEKTEKSTTESDTSEA